MSFDWLKFLDQHHIEYVTAGANVSKGNITITCPFCAGTDPDPSHHMSIATEGQGWRCWRKHDHKGKHPARLVAALLGCDLGRARSIVGDSRNIPGDFAARVMAQLAPKARTEPRKLDMPPEFKPFRDLPSAKPFIRYLRDRGFDQTPVSRWTDDYDLRYCTQGVYKGRVIFPVYYRDNLVTWTGRTIYPQVDLRYKTLSDKEERAQREGYRAVAPISEFLLWYDDIRASNAGTLLLVEGPFDAFKLRVLGRRLGVEATCFFTSQPSDTQVGLIHSLSPRYARKYLLLDAGTLATAMRVLWQHLGALGVVIKVIPTGYKDPGELDERGLRHLLATQ